MQIKSNFPLNCFMPQHPQVVSCGFSRGKDTLLRNHSTIVRMRKLTLICYLQQILRLIQVSPASFFFFFLVIYRKRIHSRIARCIYWQGLFSFLGSVQSLAALPSSHDFHALDVYEVYIPDILGLCCSLGCLVLLHDHIQVLHLGQDSHRRDIMYLSPSKSHHTAVDVFPLLRTPPGLLRWIFKGTVGKWVCCKPRLHPQPSQVTWMKTSCQKRTSFPEASSLRVGCGA